MKHPSRTRAAVIGAAAATTALAVPGAAAAKPDVFTIVDHDGRTFTHTDTSSQHDATLQMRSTIHLTIVRAPTRCGDEDQQAVAQSHGTGFGG